MKRGKNFICNLKAGRKERAVRRGMKEECDKRGKEKQL